MSENLFQLQGGRKSYGSKVLFDSATFAVNAGEHVGVIGPNGAGKSTLMRVLSGEEQLDEGKVTRSRSLRLAVLSQHDRWDPGMTGNQYLESVARIPLWDVKSRGTPLQVTEQVLGAPILSLSGGYRMRIKLLGLLAQDPNVMALDEPTNYLDLETTLLLERFLQGYDGAFLLISHDREFLRRTTDHILEIEGGEMTKYNGNIDDYFEQKEMLRTQLQARAMSLAEKRRTILDFVARFGASATKARQAQSRLKTLAKMETIEVKSLPVGAQVKIPAPVPTGKLALKVDGAAFGYGARKVIEGVSFTVARGDHVAVVGLNGAGKSTLLKGIAGQLDPLAGQVERGMGVETALFAQHVIEDLVLTDTVYESLERAAHPGIRPQEVLDLAGSLLFSGDDTRKRVSVLSGGERSRVALGRVLLRKAPCLVLDEPTNHLDFQTVEALTEALMRYAGTVIVVSHDRGFVRRVGTKILEVSNGGVRLYPGTYDEYVWSVERSMVASGDGDGSVEAGARAAARASSDRDAPGAPSGVMAPSARGEPNRWARGKELERRLRACERAVAGAETELEEKQKRVAEINAELIARADAPMSLIREMGDHQERIAELEAAWLAACEERDAVSAELEALKAQR